jgi:hypothetical protein
MYFTINAHSLSLLCSLIQKLPVRLGELSVLLELRGLLVPTISVAQQETSEQVIDGIY